MIVPENIRGRFGEQVTVTNPNHAHTSWTGRLIGYADFPTVDIEQDDGFRISLPAAWVEKETR